MLARRYQLLDAQMDDMLDTDVIVMVCPSSQLAARPSGNGDDTRLISPCYCKSCTKLIFDVLIDVIRLR